MPHSFKKTTLLFCLIIAVLAILVAFRYGARKMESEEQAGFAVVELFTSEGCSSCPAADAVVSKIVKKYSNNVFVLGYHVDYWDRQGWKDAYSNAAFTDRQQQYGALFKLNSIYTPQVIVNGGTEFTGSDENRLTAAINNGLNGEAGRPITCLAKLNEGNKVMVSYSIGESPNSLLHLALIQSSAQTSVLAGENQGRTLLHNNIVREFKTVTPGKTVNGTVLFTLPQNLEPTNAMVVAFLQDKTTFRILGSTQSRIR